MASTATALSELEEIEMTPLEKAQSYDGRMRDLEKQISQTWYEAGQIGLAMRNSRGWELLNFGSFNQWLLDAAPKSRSVVYAAINALEELNDVPAEELKEIAHSTVHILKKLPKEVRKNPAVREAAKKLTTKEFGRKMKADHPELHLENYIKTEFLFEASQEKVIDEAIEKAKALYDLPTKELAIEAICADWLLTENGEKE